MTLYYVLVIVAIVGATLAIEHVVWPKMRETLQSKGWID